MNDDIKEILNQLKMMKYDESSPEISLDLISRKAEKILLDYIINLQKELKSVNESITWWTNRFKAVEKENKQLNKRLEMLFKKEYPFIVENGIICKKNKEIENLQKENKHLKDLYNQALKDYDELLKEQ